ncbi:hypothetical protein QQ045_029529 [Rhodiola kirilowii]
MNHAVSISLSDDEFDYIPSNSRSVRASDRRKRKKSAFLRRRRNETFLLLVRAVVRWRFVMLCVIALGFLGFAFLSSTKSLDGVKPHLAGSDVVGVRKGEPNLDQLKPTTRMVNGVRERCLKILPPEKLEYFDIPSVKKPSSPVEKVVYLSDADRAFVDDNATLSKEHAEASRFNLFTGYQTLEERRHSYKVNGTATVHCGFYSENGGFKISEQDRNYMHRCQVVVSTCTFGGGDDLYQPIGMSDTSLRKVCYVAFWDEITLATQESQGQRISEDHMIGKWRIVVVKELPFVDQRLNGKIPKMLSHRLFPQAKYSIWVDSKSQFRRDPLGVLEALLWRTNSELAISEHGARSNVYDEAVAVVKKHKATPEEVEVQLQQYRKDGFPNDKRFNGKKALAEASVIVREHTPVTNMFMCLWFNEVVRFTSRDQLSFPYVLRSLKGIVNLNMFPVCTRKDLMNSMGHKRKAKPLSHS